MSSEKTNKPRASKTILNGKVDEDTEKGGSSSFGTGNGPLVRKLRSNPISSRHINALPDPNTDDECLDSENDKKESESEHESQYDPDDENYEVITVARKQYQQKLGTQSIQNKRQKMLENLALTVGVSNAGAMSNFIIFATFFARTLSHLKGYLPITLGIPETLGFILKAIFVLRSDKSWKEKVFEIVSEMPSFLTIMTAVIAMALVGFGVGGAIGATALAIATLGPFLFTGALAYNAGLSSIYLGKMLSSFLVNRWEFISQNRWKFASRVLTTLALGVAAATIIAFFSNPFTAPIFGGILLGAFVGLTAFLVIQARVVRYLNRKAIKEVLAKEEKDGKSLYDMFDLTKEEEALRYSQSEAGNKTTFESILHQKYAARIGAIDFILEKINTQETLGHEQKTRLQPHLAKLGLNNAIDDDTDQIILTSDQINAVKAHRGEMYKALNLLTDSRTRNFYNTQKLIQTMDRENFTDFYKTLKLIKEEDDVEYRPSFKQKNDTKHWKLRMWFNYQKESWSKSESWGGWFRGSEINKDGENPLAELSIAYYVLSDSDLKLKYDDKRKKINSPDLSSNTDDATENESSGEERENTNTRHLSAESYLQPKKKGFFGGLLVLFGCGGDDVVKTEDERRPDHNYDSRKF